MKIVTEALKNKHYAKFVLESVIEFTGNENEHVNLDTIMSIYPIPKRIITSLMSEIALSFHEKSSSCGKGYIIKPDGSKYVIYIGFKLINATGINSSVSKTATSVSKVEVSIPVLAPNPLPSVPVKAPEVQKPTVKSEKSASVELITHEPSVKSTKDADGFFYYEEHEGCFITGWSYIKSEKKGWLRAKYDGKIHLIRKGSDQMAILDENAPECIKEVWEKAKNGEI